MSNRELIDYLRDYFAACALQGILANHEVPILSPGQTMQGLAAEQAYVFADAMMKQRLMAIQN